MSWIVRHRTVELAGFCMAMLLCGVECRAQAMSLPATTQFPLFAKILTYDRNLDHRAKGGIVVGILYQGRFHLSLNAAEMLLSAIQNGSVRTITGIPVRGVLVDIAGVENLEGVVASSGANVLYVTPLRAIDIGSIRTICKRMKLLSMTGVPEYVEEGIALGIDIADDRPLIMINIRAAVEGGSDLSSQVLKVARIIP